MKSALRKVIKDLLPVADPLEDSDDAADREACENACYDRALEECVCCGEILLIDRLIRRQEEGLATPKQIRLLERYGFRKVGTWSFDAASNMISRVASCNWNIPRGVSAASYVPA